MRTSALQEGSDAFDPFGDFKCIRPPGYTLADCVSGIYEALLLVAHELCRKLHCFDRVVHIPIAGQPPPRRAAMPTGTTLAICLFHPAPSDPVMKALPPEYQLSRAQLLDACASFSGLSVTVEHYGMQRASARIAGDIDHAAVTKELMKSPRPRHRRVGVCLDTFEATSGAFYCIVELIWDSMRGLKWLVESKQLGSCSLTHTLERGRVVPLELSLVGKPARPGCTVTVGDPLTLFAYKRGLQSKAHTSMDTSSFENIILALNPEQRDVVMAKFQSMKAKNDDAAQRLASTEAKLADSKFTAETDVDLLVGQLNQLLGSMSAEAKDQYSVTVDGYLASLKTRDTAEMAKSSLRLIMCANYDNMKKMLNEQSGAKRSRTEETVHSLPPAASLPPVEQLVHAPPAEPREAPVELSERDQLRLSLAATFGTD